MKVILIVIPNCCLPKRMCVYLISDLKKRGFDALVMYTASPLNSPIQVFDLDKLNQLEIDEVRDRIDKALEQ